MNTKNNKRHRNTISKIENVFMELLKKQELSQIKVSVICEHADINRSTFYANYVDVYDLAEKIKERLKNEVNRLFEQEVKWQYTEDNFLKLFQHIKENQKLYTFYFKLGYDASEDLKLYDVYMSNSKASSNNLDYHVAFFKSGFNAIVKKWLDCNCKETPQQMKDILLSEYIGRFD